MEYRTREQWGATYDANRRPVIKLPITDLFIHHNTMFTTNNPNHDMRTTEDVGVARFGYPSYSWGIHPSGVVLEGMTNHLSAHTAGHNSTSMAIMFMGNYDIDYPTDAAMSAGRELIYNMVGWGWVVEPIDLRGHRDVYATACPGANLYPRIGELLGDDDMTPDDRAQLDNVRKDVTTAVKEVRDVRTDVTSLHVKVDQAMQRLDKIIAKLK